MNDVAKGYGGIETASTSDMWQGQVFTSIPRARRGLVPGFIHATAVARHNDEGRS